MFGKKSDCPTSILEIVKQADCSFWTSVLVCVLTLLVILYFIYACPGSGIPRPRNIPYSISLTPCIPPHTTQQRFGVYSGFRCYAVRLPPVYPPSTYRRCRLRPRPLCRTCGCNQRGAMPWHACSCDETRNNPRSAMPVYRGKDRDTRSLAFTFSSLPSLGVDQLDMETLTEEGECEEMNAERETAEHDGTGATRDNADGNTGN